MTAAAPAREGIPFLHFDSRRQAPEEALERWRTINVEVAMSTPDADGQPSRGFEVDAALWHLGTLLWGGGRLSAQQQSRGTALIRRDQVDHYRLVYLRPGRTALESDADGRRTRLGPGELLITDMARPESIRWRDSVEFGMLWVPRETLDAALPWPLDLHGMVARGPACALLLDHLQALQRWLPELSRAELPPIVRGTVQMMAAGIAPSAASLAAARPALDATLRRQARRHVEQHLGDPGLSAETLCGVLKVSRSTLYRLFEPLGGVAHHIKERRLVRVHELLTSPEPPRHIGRLAADHGFSNPTHFSREFRLRFGCSPTDAQALAAGAETQRERTAARGASTRQWLTSLQG